MPSLNILLTSTAWRNDHNGFSHQGPGLIQNVITQRGSVGRVYLPPDANTLLSVADHCLRSRSYVNLVVIDKQPQLQWLSIDDAIAHCARGAGVWDWAGTDDGTADPDIVLACAGDVVTMETVAAASILRDRVPQLRTRVVNVVDLMALMRPKDHPHGMDPTLFNELFTDHVDVVFAFHGYPGAIHQLVHGRPDADRFRVRGFIEEGTTTTPFDMVVRNKASRYHLVMDALNNARRTPAGASDLMAWCRQRLDEHNAYVVEHLEDMPDVRDWVLGDWAEEGLAQLGGIRYDLDAPGGRPVPRPRFPGDWPAPRACRSSSRSTTGTRISVTTSIRSESRWLSRRVSWTSCSRLGDALVQRRSGPIILRTRSRSDLFNVHLTTSRQMLRVLACSNGASPAPISRCTTLPPYASISAITRRGLSRVR